MSENREHVDFDVLNDYVDARLDHEAIQLIDKHLAECAECAGELRSLRQLLTGVEALSASVLPETDLWGDVRQEIEQRKSVVLRRAPADTEPANERSPIRWTLRTRVWMAVAAVVLVVLSSGTTALVLRQGGSGQVADDSLRDPADGLGLEAPRTLPVSFRIAEGQFTATIEELRAAVDAQRSQLNPETVRTVDHSLAVVDSAIAEAREALLADPNNRTLVDLLSASYQRKLDLLRRTSELSSQI